MGMLNILLGKKADSPGKPRNSRTPPASTQFVASQMSPGSANSTRKDLLRLVTREVLTRNGIPQAWLSTDTLRTTNSKKEQGVHVRFHIRVWEPRLMLHGPALEQEFIQRLCMLDPQAETWLNGFSWQFLLPDLGVCPPLPHPSTWTAPPEDPVDTAPAPATRPADIIEGPTVLPKTVDEVKADLERLLALRDEDAKRHAPGGDHFAPTRPASF